MEYKISEQQLQQLSKILEDAPWKYAMPAMELLRQVVEENLAKAEEKKENDKK